MKMTGIIRLSLCWLELWHEMDNLAEEILVSFEGIGFVRCWMTADLIYDIIASAINKLLIYFMLIIIAPYQRPIDIKL